MDKKDLYIKSKLQQDDKISSQANEIFEKFEGGINLENNNKPNERKIIKLSLNHAILAFTSLIVVVVLGGNLYAHLNGKPNIYSAIKGLFVKEDKYTASEITVDQTVESNGIKLTLKTVAMDENVLITKYVAEGERLANEFYTYTEFEEDMIDMAKIYFAAMNVDIGEEKYKNIKSSDATEAYNKAKSKLISIGLVENEAIEVLKAGHFAYKEYIGAELGGIEGTTSEKAEELISKAIAMFESKVSSKYQIIQSNDTLQEFGIYAISQKIERSGNQYIIYNVYNVDTISDLASKFNLNINVTQIGKTKGKWNFSTELEKARLDTRVETIDFYENNSYDNVAPAITGDGVRHSATVEVKRLVISDFSTVVMIQTKVKEEDREYYLKYAEDGLPCIFVITDENGDVVGTGTTGEGTYEYACADGTEIRYTDRIILENVDKDTKKLYVKIYEPYYIAEGDTVELNTTTIELDIEAARNSNKPVELTQSFASKDVQMSFKYPGEWTTKETMESEVILVGPEDIDGNRATISMRKISKEDYDDIKESTPDYGHGEFLEEGEAIIAGAKGFYRISTLIDIGTYIKQKSIILEKDEQYFAIYYAAYADAQYVRYEETFHKILETIEFMEPEKSYVTYYMDNSSDSAETVKVYEDNTVTVQIAKSAIIAFDKELETRIEANVEYQITGISSKIVGMDFLNSIEGGAYVGSCLFIYGENNKLYLIDMHEGIATGKFEAKEINVKNRLTRPQCEDIVIDGEIPAVAVVVYDKDGQGYTISRDGTVEKYVKTENNNQQQTQQEITDAQAKEVIQKYFDINARITGGPVEMLEYNCPLELNAKIDRSKYLNGTYGNVYVNTNIKYEDFINEMLKYMSVDIYNNNRYSEKYINVDGILYAADVGASGYRAEIEIERMNRNGDKYGYNVYVKTYEGEAVYEETYYFELQNVEGNMIITSISVG